MAHGPSARRLALVVTGAFLAAGLAWILLTDVLLYELIHDPLLIARIETAKGWAFVGLSALLLYTVTFCTARRLERARRLLATVVESIADGILLLGPDRTILHANAAALKQLHALPKELAGMGGEAFSRRYRVSYLDGRLVPPDEFASQRVFTDGGIVRYKCVLNIPGGEPLIISSTGAAVRERPDEPPALVVSVMHDITESEQLEQLRDQFFAAAAHSLKTPIAVIGAHAHVLAEEVSPQARRSAAVVERQCARMDALVQNLLVLSRARSGTLSLHPRAVLLSSIVERVARDRVVASLDRPLELEVVDDVCAIVDEERLVTALRNLVHDVARGSGGPLTLLLRRRGEDAELGVRSRSPTAGEPPAELSLEQDDRAVGREVTELVVQAHGGSQHVEPSETGEVRWIRLPAQP